MLPASTQFAPILEWSPCGEKAAFATKGYFAKQRNRRGRQLGRVLASHYAEIVVDRLG